MTDQEWFTYAIEHGLAFKRQDGLLTVGGEQTKVPGISLRLPSGVGVGDACLGAMDMIARALAEESVAKPAMVIVRDGALRVYDISPICEMPEWEAKFSGIMWAEADAGANALGVGMLAGQAYVISIREVAGPSHSRYIHFERDADGRVSKMWERDGEGEQIVSAVVNAWRSGGRAAAEPETPETGKETT